MKNFKPMLAASVTMEEACELLKIGPLLASPKYDGVRACVLPGKGLVTRTLKPVPNVAVRAKFSALEYFDGELILGAPVAKDCYNRTESVVMSREHPEGVDVKFYVFDCFEEPQRGYNERLKEGKLFGAQLVPQKLMRNADELIAEEARVVRLGYEGLMLRWPNAPYKFGRSTAREAYLLKLKRYHDGEAKVLGVFERQANTNAQERDERGYAKRSKAKAGMQPAGELGGFHCRDLATGVEFDCAPGVLTQAQRKALWKQHDELIGKIIKYRCQLAGAKDKPRFPRFYGFRSKLDF